MSSVELETDAPKMRRRSSQDIVDRVAVRRAMAELVGVIEHLQHETVFLKARLARHPADQEELMPSIVTLGQGVTAARAKFEVAVAALTEQQRGHSRVDDIRRTLDALRASAPRLPN